ncbi:acyl carrier protein [Derxia gummosa]|uniref:Acyl carrier protein n=1 Tax=Derxia gummosa DSM 723 TaxID=1121388 RepID=A0A8B6X4S1_9BURK|nr:acyl carrier protein [Derxia gummosa]
MNDFVLDGAPRADLSAQEALEMLLQLKAAEAAPAGGMNGPAAGATAATAGADALVAALCGVLAELTADVLKLALAEVPAARPLVELGLDSVGATDLMGRFNERFALDVPSTVLFEFDNLADLARHLAGAHGAELRTQLGLAAAVAATPSLAAAPTAVMPVVPVVPAVAAPVAATPAVTTSPVTVAPAIAPVALQPPLSASQPAMTTAATSQPVAPTATVPATASRRREVQALWAEIEARLDAEDALASAARSAPAATFAAAPTIVAAPATADTDPAWTDCRARLARLGGRGRALAFPALALAEAALPALAGLARHAGVLRLTPEAGAGERLDPHHEAALEILLARATPAGPLLLVLDAARRGAGTPTHLLRAIERLRASGALLLGLLDDQLADVAALAGLARALEPDFLLVGAEPFVALHLGAPLLASADTGALDRHAARYRNDYAAAALAGRLAALDAAGAVA